MLFLFRTLHVRGPGVTAAALVFMLSPYTLAFASRLSVILLPWAGLPWMLALVIRALRDDRGWKYPAIFAIVVQLVGSVNATALVFVGIVPVLWVLYAVFVDTRDGSPARRGRRRQDRAAHAARIAVVDRGADGPERVRPRHLEVHRDARDGVAGQPAAGGPARARLLVLLRSRQDRPVDRAERRLHAGSLAPRGHATRCRSSHCSPPRSCVGGTAPSS